MSFNMVSQHMKEVRATLIYLNSKHIIYLILWSPVLEEPTIQSHSAQWIVASISCWRRVMNNYINEQLVLEIEKGNRGCMILWLTTKYKLSKIICFSLLTFWSDPNSKTQTPKYGIIKNFEEPSLSKRI